MITLFRSRRVPPNDMQVRALAGGRDLVEAANSAPLSLVLGEYSYGRKLVKVRDGSSSERVSFPQYHTKILIHHRNNTLKLNTLIKYSIVV